MKTSDCKEIKKITEIEQSALTKVKITGSKKQARKKLGKRRSRLKSCKILESIVFL
jgi:hypothetical protein